MKIALGAAKGLAFLHEGEKPIIYRDLKSSNILLDAVISLLARTKLKYLFILHRSSRMRLRPGYYLFQDYNPKLSDFGLAIDGPQGSDKHVTTRVMGTEGYAAPEYLKMGKKLHTFLSTDAYDQSGSKHCLMGLCHVNTNLTRHEAIGVCFGYFLW